MEIFSETIYAKTFFSTVSMNRVSDNQDAGNKYFYATNVKQHL